MWIEYRLLVDTVASGRRFLVSVALMAFAVILGLHMGVLPYWEKLFLRFVTFFDKIPALALLPILFIVFGLGELSTERAPEALNRTVLRKAEKAAQPAYRRSVLWTRPVAWAAVVSCAAFAEGDGGSSTAGDDTWTY